MICPKCGKYFSSDSVRTEFDNYYAGSSEWKYDEVGEDLCFECASENCEDLWMNSELNAADGPPRAEYQEQCFAIQNEIDKMLNR